MIAIKRLMYVRFQPEKRKRWIAAKGMIAIKRLMQYMIDMSPDMFDLAAKGIIAIKRLMLHSDQKIGLDCQGRSTGEPIWNWPT